LYRKNSNFVSSIPLANKTPQKPASRNRKFASGALLASRSSPHYVPSANGSASNGRSTTNDQKSP
jgi:hypothetical protein